MNYLTIDAEFCDHLRGVLETVELRDASGKVLGHFTPFISAEERALYEKAKTLFDSAEIQRRLAEADKRVSHEDVMRRLCEQESSR
ncbi:MAG: hypothetical protein ACRELG_07255 [Gemmataceae bacterium]